MVKEVVVGWTKPCLYFARQPRLATILYRVLCRARPVSADGEANGQCEEYGDNRRPFECGLTKFDRKQAAYVTVRVRLNRKVVGGLTMCALEWLKYRDKCLKVDRTRRMGLGGEPTYMHAPAHRHTNTPRASIMREILILVALILSGLATMQVVASEKTDAVAPVHQFVAGFNKGDFKSAVAACADTASVIDDFPPHAWQGSGCKEWADGFEAITRQEGITEARIILGTPRHIDVTGDHAYVVVPVSLDYKVKDKSKRLPSLFTAAIHKEANGWHITGWAWTDL